MRRKMTLILTATLIASFCVPAWGRDRKKPQPRFFNSSIDYSAPDIPGYGTRLQAAISAADTYCIVSYDFEMADWQGWTRRDNGDQLDTFFHVEDFAGLGGGTFGRLVPLEGTRSLWCGARGGNEYYSCGWVSAPGYGNKWNQMWSTDAFYFSGILMWSYKCMTDSEPVWDFTLVEYDSGDRWKEITRHDGIDTFVAEHQIRITQAATKLRFHFVSDGAWSDEDGNYNGDGACIIDSITVADETGVMDFEDFETAEAGDKETDFWQAETQAGFGKYSGLSSGLQDYDPCNRNLSTVVTFFHGSPWPSDDYPGLYETPYPPHYVMRGQDEMIISPPIDLTRYSTGRDDVQDTEIPSGDLAAMNTALLRFSVYVDLPLINRIVYTWKVRSIENGCPGPWFDDGLLSWSYSGSRSWLLDIRDISTMVTSDTIQVAVGVLDICGYAWLPVPPECAEHTPAPWFDNVYVLRTGADSPSWQIDSYNLFQDTFPQDVPGSPDPMEEFCRADMSDDVAPYDEFGRIDPGDSAVVRAAAPFAGGLDTLGTGEARVYCHVNVTYIGEMDINPKPDLFGPQLEGTYGSYVTDIGDWTVLLCEPARAASGVIAPDAYCIDLNDSLFTRGYMVEYYFKAWDLEGSSSTWPQDAEETGGKIFEFTCLPTLRRQPGALYVDDFHGRGTFEGTAETYWNYVFGDSWPCCIVPPYDSIPPDRYDVNGPSSGVSNGVGAYTSVTDASSVFSQAYEVVIFDSGDLGSLTICEGTEHSDKSRDAQLLVDWMNVSEHKTGLLVMGDQIASDLDGSTTSAAFELVSTLCGVTLENGSYYEMTGGFAGGGAVSPVITGVAGGPFEGLEYYAFGGCPYVNDFDVLEVTGPGAHALQYPDYNSMPYYAGIYTDQLNNASQPLRTVWAGHSLMSMRNTGLSGVVRKEFVWKVNEFFERYGWGVYSETPAMTSLLNNFPNPFNPATRVKFGLKEKGPVSLRIYDVSGRLVRVLVDEIREAGSYEAVWDGTNNEGRSTASGIYFCRMEAANYERTLKMVLLR